MYSDNSDDEFNANDFYHRKYRLLLEKCEVIQQVRNHNEANFYYNSS